ncbi:MAG: hypothetical protein QNK37_21560 [Acidobacteriota bacterium]|nr:hypothetical protein [Acidobacteriota bacterium]
MDHGTPQAKADEHIRRLTACIPLDEGASEIDDALKILKALSKNGFTETLSLILDGLMREEAFDLLPLVLQEELRENPIRQTESGSGGLIHSVTAVRLKASPEAVAREVFDRKWSWWKNGEVLDRRKKNGKVSFVLKPVWSLPWYVSLPARLGITLSPAESEEIATRDRAYKRPMTAFPTEFGEHFKGPGAYEIIHVAGGSVLRSVWRGVKRVGGVVKYLPMGTVLDVHLGGEDGTLGWPLPPETGFKGLIELLEKPKKAKPKRRKRKRSFGNPFLAPFITLPNLAMSAAGVSVGLGAKAVEIAARTAVQAGMPMAPRGLEDMAGRIAERTLTDAREMGGMAEDGIKAALGVSTEKTMETMLAETWLDNTTLTASIPLTMTWDGVQAAMDQSRLKDMAETAGIQVSSVLDRFSDKGVITGSMDRKTNADVRFGFYYMTTKGPLGAIARDVRGMVGGAAALGMGDYAWLEEGMDGFNESVFYVYDKKQHGQAQPKSDFPIGRFLASDSVRIWDNWPETFFKALGGGKADEIMRDMTKDNRRLGILAGTYFPFTARVLWDVVVFVQKAMRDAPDAQNYALCELAVMESDLSNAEKDAALEELRPTAPNSVIEFEYYVPLLVPFDGKPEDQCERRNAAGEPIDDPSKAVSVFNQEAIWIAQSICSEVFSLRSFMWLYGDEKTAREKNYQETCRKFGPRVAKRLEVEPRYPLSDDEIEKLVRGGPRSQEDIHDIWNKLLKDRGLKTLADRLRAPEAAA